MSIETSEKLLIRSRSVVSRVVAGETLIVPVRGKVGDLASIYSFNGTGSLIWQMLDEPRGRAELGRAVAREFEVEPERAQNDVERFVAELFSAGLVEVYQCAAAGAHETANQSTWETAVR